MQLNCPDGPAKIMRNPINNGQMPYGNCLPMHRLRAQSAINTELTSKHIFRENNRIPIKTLLWYAA